MPRPSVDRYQFGTGGAQSPILRGKLRTRTQTTYTSADPPAEQPQCDSAAVFVAAGSPQFLAGLIPKLTFGPENGIEGAYCPDPPALFAALERHSPMVVLVDCELFHQLGHRLLSDIRSRFTHARLVLVFDQHWNVPESEILVNNVRGCLPADRPPEFYLKALHSILAGELWLPKRLVQRIIQSLSEQLGIRHPAPGNGLLTARESEIGDLVLVGLTNKEIGHRLHISEDTVKKHLKNVFAKCGIHRRSQMAAVRINHSIGSKAPRE
jgi:DNA-binding NarL/FixJ family response regulator